MDDGLRLRLNAIIALQALTVVALLGPPLLDAATGITTIVIMVVGLTAFVAAAAYVLIIALESVFSNPE